MKYKMTKRENPQKRTEKKWYAAPVYNGKVTKTDISKELVSMSSLSRGEVANVIENLLEIIPKHLLTGKSISLGELGTLHISFSSKGTDDPEIFSADMVRSRKIIFTAGPELRKKMADLSFEEVK
ncbi:MAG: HU family DNA-binding protein [Bacteroidales bacterium]|jgi:predicted histone-like DNA-binding protein|nr:HU family DNA-binding protein [Bacteroidales bacterium]